MINLKQNILSIFLFKNKSFLYFISYRFYRLQELIDGCQLSIAHSAKGPPGHMGLFNNSALAESVNKLLFRPAFKATGGIRSKIGSSKYIGSAIRWFFKNKSASIILTNECASHQISIGMAAPAISNAIGEVL